MFGFWDVGADIIRPQKQDVTIVGKSSEISMLRGRTDIRPYGMTSCKPQNPDTTEQI